MRISPALRGPRQLHAMAAALGLLLSAAGCSADGSAACTEVGCEDSAVVTLPAGLVSGPYELTLSNGPDTDTTYFCSDPQQAGANPPGVTCDGAQITIEGEFAARSSLTVSIVDENGDTVVARQDVTLQAVETLEPNGPDCEPICVVRNGRLLP